jgi:nicotinamide mononucleotide (NMN) deamidase PncC
MDGSTRAVVSAIHAASYRYILATTGGGATAAGLLLSVPGGSRTLLEAITPYSEQALSQFLGFVPQSYCSVETARAMAGRALERARALAPGMQVAGAACAASLRSDRPKRGDHRFFVVIQNARGGTTYSTTLTKDARDREGEEAVVRAAVLNALAESFGATERVPSLLLAEESLVRGTFRAGPLATFLSGESPYLCVEPDGQAHFARTPPTALLPGSFNPLHHGHAALAEVAERVLGVPAAYEMTVVNADKPPLSDEEVYRRVGQFAWRAPIWLTRAPTFPAKARLFPATTFVVGADTAARIVDPRFYGGSEVNLHSELAEFRAGGCRFLVAGRADKAGHFFGLEQITIPTMHRDLFTPIPERLFRTDVSSTQLRDSVGP